MSDHLKKHLTTQLELLDESSLDLQNRISDFVQQIKTRANECVDNMTGSSKTVRDAITMVTTAQSTILEHIDMFSESTKLSPTTVMTLEKTTSDIQVMKDPISVEYYPEKSRRLNDFEIALSSLQDTKQKTEDDISEIKQWRDNFVTEHSDMGIKFENLSKKQKQNLKNLRKKINEQDNKIEQLIQQIDSLKTKEQEKDKRLEKLSLDMKEYENNWHTINKEMRVYTDKTDHLTQEIKRHSDLISAIQEDTTKRFDKLLSKHVVTCKLLQQRLMPIHKIIETYNQNSESREGKMKKNKTVEKDVLMLSQNLQSIAANQQVKHSTLGFIASQGVCGGKLYNRYNVITFSAVERNVGNHFDPNTGEFTAPVDGLYKASLTIKHTGDRDVTAGVIHISGGKMSRRGVVRTQDKTVYASATFEVRMKTGDVLFSATGLTFTDMECSHFSCSL